MIPTKIALLTDSSADLRWEEARENNIFFVPLRILCQDGEYLDGVDIRGQDIYQRLRSGELPQTSLPRVEDFKITQEHGQWFQRGGVQMTAIYHPAALLRDEQKRPETFVDLKNIQAKVRELCEHTEC